MRSELAFVASAVVNGVPAQFIVGDAILVNSVSLGEDLRPMQIRDAFDILVLEEEAVVVVRRRPVIDRLLEAHVEVGHAHRLRVPNLGELLQGQLLRREGLPGHCLI